MRRRDTDVHETSPRPLSLLLEPAASVTGLHSSSASRSRDAASNRSLRTCRTDPLSRRGSNDRSNIQVKCAPPATKETPTAIDFFFDRQQDLDLSVTSALAKRAPRRRTHRTRPKRLCRRCSTRVETTANKITVTDPLVFPNVFSWISSTSFCRCYHLRQDLSDPCTHGPTILLYYLYYERPTLGDQ